MTITPTLITPPAAPTFSAWQVDFDHPGDAMTAMIVGAQLGYQTNALCQGTIEAPIWQSSFTQPRLESQIAYEHDWIVSDGETITCYTHEAFCAGFTVDVPLVWSAASSVPAARPTAGGSAEVIVPLPSSPTGPWTWTVSAGTVSSVAVQDGNVVLQVTGLTVGQTYEFTVTVTDHYGHGATSEVANSITAVS